MKLYIKEFCKNLNSNDNCYYSSGYQYAYSTYVLPEITLNIESYSITPTPTPRVLKAVWTVDVT